MWWLHAVLVVRCGSISARDHNIERPYLCFKLLLPSGQVPIRQLKALCISLHVTLTCNTYLLPGPAHPQYCAWRMRPAASIHWSPGDIRAMLMDQGRPFSQQASPDQA
jgi:hypothetical protein